MGKNKTSKKVQENREKKKNNKEMEILKTLDEFKGRNQKAYIHVIDQESKHIEYLTKTEPKSFIVKQCADHYLNFMPGCQRGRRAW